MSYIEFKLTLLNYYSLKVLGTSWTLQVSSDSKRKMKPEDEAVWYKLLKPAYSTIKFFYININLKIWQASEQIDVNIFNYIFTIK